MSNKTKKPIILKRMILKPGAKLPIKSNLKNVNQKLFKVATIPLYREDVIFESKGEAYIGEYQSVKITNKLNNLTSNCQTIAHCITKSHEVIVKTSDKVTQVIGHEAYNTVFYTLCSVINQEYRIKGILSLLTAKGSPPVKLADMGLSKACQTDETRIVVKKARPRKRVRKQPVPYAVKPDEIKVKRLTIIPEHCVPAELRERKTLKTVVNSSTSDFVPLVEKIESIAPNESEKLYDLGNLDGSDSVKSFSMCSFQTTPELMFNPLSLVDDVEKHTQQTATLEKVTMNHKMVLKDGTEIILPFKPEDEFHKATEEILKYLNEHDKKKLLLHQMHIDFKHCLSRDEDGNLPIHIAVINDDIPVLKRQCAVLNIRQHTVDIPTTNGLTALKMSLYRDSAVATSVLLSHGADPFLDVDQHRTCAHAAAERNTDHLAHILHHCKIHARSIIAAHVDELQTPGWDEHTDEQLGSVLIDYLCASFDKQGYTPLMLASNLGMYENTRLLAESSPKSVDLAMPTCGNTALFLAVASACAVAAESGNKSKIVDHFRRTVEILLDFGADPSTDNNYGSNANMLLQEFNCVELSMLIANRITHNRFTDEDSTRNFNEFVILKEGGSVSLQELKKNRKNEKTEINILKGESLQEIKKNGKNENIKTEVILTEGESVSLQELKKNRKNYKTENVKDLNELVIKTEQVDDLNEVVTKSVVNLIPKDRIVTECNKPIITENIVLKEPNDFKIKVKTVPILKRVVWYQPKRKSENNDTKNPKKKA